MNAAAPYGAPVAVRVTAGHIAAGEPCECASCPIAIALTEALGGPGDNYVTVYNDEVLVSRSNVLVSAKLPQSAIDFIVRFDTAQDVEPFDFELTWRREP